MFSKVKNRTSSSHIKTRHSYDFPLYFPRELLVNSVRYYTTLRAYPHDMIAVYDSSLWRMRLCHKSTIPACGANEQAHTTAVSRK